MFSGTGTARFTVLRKFRIKHYHAFRAEPVAELGFRMVGDVGFYLLPVSMVITDLLA